MNKRPGSAADPEVRRICAVISSLCRLRSVSKRELERRLNLSPGYLTRILGGAVKLKLCHVLDICRILEIPPGLLFSHLFPAPALPPTEVTRALRAVAELHPPVSLLGDPSER